MQNHKFSNTRSIIGLFALVSVLLLAMLPFAAGYPVSARSAAQDTTPTPPVATWTGTFVVRPDLQFVWLRVAPFSSGSVAATAYPNQRLTAVAAPDGQTQVWDGAQWWGYVTVSEIGVSGWVEVASLQPGPSPTPTPTMAPEGVATWGVSTAVRVKESVAFLWLRQTPSSDAITLYQVPSGSVMVTIAPPQSDGVQNWWPVFDVQSGVMGWAEQRALVPASIGKDINAAVLIPVPTPESWQPGNKVRVRANVNVSAVHAGPNSHAPTLTRVFSGNILDIVGTPLFADGEWWWLVRTRGTQITGWVAGSALEIAPADA